MVENHERGPVIVRIEVFLRNDLRLLNHFKLGRVRVKANQGKAETSERLNNDLYG